MTETARIEVDMAVLDILRDSDIPYKLILVDVKDFDYTTSDLWKATKAKADKLYRDLKQVEFHLRNNMPHE